jgi:hypothetical protein
MKRISLFVAVMLVCPMMVFGQLMDTDTGFRAGSVFEDYPAKPDSGKRVEKGGLFFTKSSVAASGDESIMAKYEQRKLSKTFEITIDRAGEFFFSANIMPANNVDKLRHAKFITYKIWIAKSN